MSTVKASDEPIAVTCPWPRFTGQASAAADVDDLAGDVASVGRRQERDGSGNSGRPGFERRLRDIARPRRRDVPRSTPSSRFAASTPRPRRPDLT